MSRVLQDYFRLMKFKYLEQHAKLDLMHNLTGEEGKILEQGENEEKGESINRNPSPRMLVLSRCV